MKFSYQVLSYDTRVAEKCELRKMQFSAGKSDHLQDFLLFNRKDIVSRLRNRMAETETFQQKENLIGAVT